MLFPQDENEESVAQPAYDDHRNSPPPSIMQDLSTASTRTILVVDPSPTVRDLIQSTLQKECLHVIFANDDASVFASIAAYHPQLILISIQLERSDGYHLCQVIRKQLHLTELPLILLGHRGGSKFDAMRARLAGSVDFLIKPLDTCQLVQVVKKHLPA